MLYMYIMANKQQSFSTWLRETRKLLGLSQQELAVRAGCSTCSLSKWENGKPIRPLYAERLRETLFKAQAAQAVGNVP
jgi:transcriptional regulator with XRE-family HTH domain